MFTIKSKKKLEAEKRAQEEELRRMAYQVEITRQGFEHAKIVSANLEQQNRERELIELEKREIEQERLRHEATARRKKQLKLKEASPETIRSLRELIRDKYSLDVEIWGLRGARKPDRWLVEQKMEKADAIMEEIMTMLDAWKDNEDGSWDPVEWERVQDIRRRLQSGDIRIWADKPLWSEARNSGA